MDTASPPDIVVIAGGAPPPRHAIALDVIRGATVVAVDAGVASALSLGLTVDVAVGDFDSLAPDVVLSLDEIVADVRRHPTDKDATDLELALGVAAERAPSRVLVTGVEGDRPDHALANLLVAASPAFRSLDVELALEHGRAWVVHDRLHGRWPHGTTLSIVPVHGAATVSVDGVRWPLDHAVLAPGTTRGISNTVTTAPSTVTVHDGVALCIVPRSIEALT